MPSRRLQNMYEKRFYLQYDIIPGCGYVTIRGEPEGNVTGLHNQLEEEMPET